MEDKRKGGRSEGGKKERREGGKEEGMALEDVLNSPLSSAEV